MISRETIDTNSDMQPLGSGAPVRSAEVNTVLLVDDHPLICEWLGTLVHHVLPNAALVAKTNLQDALSVAKDREIDLVLLDLGLPGCSGIEALAQFKKCFPKPRVVIVSARDEPPIIKAALRAGAAGFLPKTLGIRVMAAALKLIVEGGVFIPPELVHDAATRHSDRTFSQNKLDLTGRQVEILQLIHRRCDNRQIAERLGISHGTVKQHVHDLLTALAVHSREEAVAEAERRGFRFD